jgi:hypothetical protein
MTKELRAFLLMFMIVLIMGGAVFLIVNLLGSGVDLSQEFESNAFTMRYPEGWTYQIPQQNIMFFASPEVLQLQAGATMSIQRSLRLSVEADSMAEALALYLERGPMRSDRAWTIVEEARTIEFDSRSALFVALEGSEQSGTIVMRSEVIITESNNGNFFLFAASAPLEQWATASKTFEAILGSVRILE